MKKTKKFMSWLLAAAIICNAGTFSFAAAKRDVNDPVLREIINELSKKMPKFIDKYGETVFVEDEPITRGALLSAIYEYDRRTKPSGAVETAPESVSQITRQEFDSLKSKVTTLEKSGVSSAKSTQKTGGSVDMVALIAELEPNMPMLLDNSLNNSKVFKSMQQQVAGVKGPAAGKDVSYALAKDVSDINVKLDTLTKRVTTTEGSISNELKTSSKDVTDINLKLDQLSKRVTTAEGNLAGSGSRGSSNNASYAAVSKDITDINVKLDQLSKRIDSSKPSGSSSSMPQKEIDELKNNLSQIQQSYVKLSKRVDDLDNRPVVLASGKTSSDADMNYINKQLSDIKKTVASVPTSTEVKNEINRSKNQTQSDIERIEKRLNSISASSSASKSSSSGESSGGGGSGATIATISLGITMIAALFVAR